MAERGMGSSARGALPTQLTSFVGRQAEIAELLALLDRSRMVTLLGAPGCGKTRLAVELGHRLVSEFPGGVWFVDLAPVNDPPLVANTVAMTLGVVEEPERSIVDTMSDGLRSAESLLLILDNCEHLGSGPADVVSQVVAAGSAVSVLATSRSVLGLSGEQVWELPPLDGEAAVDLFVDRARLVFSGFSLDRDTQPAVQGICARLDGLPLAVELAAAWTRVLSAHEIADRLGDALVLLNNRSSAAVPRHRTMSATVDWSYQLLPPAARRLFDRLSVFAGGFNLEAAAAIAPPGDDLLSALTCLVDQSLVHATPMADAPTRYRLLEPVRQFGQARLMESDGAASVRRAHVEFFISVARRSRPSRRDVRGWISHEELLLEEDNLHTAFEWARAHAPGLALQLGGELAAFWINTRRTTVGLGWLTDLVSSGAGDRAIEATGLFAIGTLANRNGHYERAKEALDQAEAGFREVGDAEGLAGTKTTQAYVALREGDQERAVRHSTESLAVSEAIGDAHWITLDLIMLGWARYLCGEAVEACDVFHKALDTAAASGYLGGVYEAHLGLNYGAFLSGDVVAQRAHLLAMHELHEAGTNPPANWLGSCAGLAAREGRHHAAVRLLGAGYAANKDGDGNDTSDAYEYLLAVAEPVIGLVLSLWPKLGRARADRLFAQGQNMTREELVAEAIAEPTDHGDDPLTRREQQIARLVGRGMSNVDIAHQLTISRRTVESHVEHIRQKLHLESRHEVMAWAMSDPGDERVS